MIDILVKKLASFKSSKPPVRDNKGVSTPKAAVCAAPISRTATKYKTNA